MRRSPFLPLLGILLFVTDTMEKETFLRSTEKNVTNLVLLLHNLATLGNTELNFISDFLRPEQAEVIEAFGSSYTIPVQVYDVAGVIVRKKLQLPEPCPRFQAGHGDPDPGGGHGHDTHDSTETHPQRDDQSIVVPTDKLHRREPFFRSDKYHQTFFVWTSRTSNLNAVLTIFNETVLVCHQKIDQGVFHPRKRFIFFDDLTGTPGIAESVFAFARFKTVSKAAVVSMLGDGKLGLYAYDFFQSSSIDEALTLRFVWSPKQLLSSAVEIFTDQTNFKGCRIRIGTNPWSHHVLGTEIPAEEGGNATSKYTDYFGYEISMLKQVAKILNFSYVILNPADGKWGHVELDGTWSGLIGDVSVGAFDVIVSDIFIIYSRTQVIDGSVTFDMDYMAFVTPMPSPLPKFLALVQPFHAFVWTTLVASVFVCTAVMCLIARGRTRLVGDHDAGGWTSFSAPFWFCYRTLLYQSPASDRSDGLRWVIGVWFAYCLVMSSSYSGALKAYMTTPTFTAAINTLKGVLDSGLPWSMVLYGEEEEAMMAQSTDPIIKKIWDEKKVEQYSPTPKIDGVYRGKSVFIDWKSGLEVAIHVHYSTPSGEPLINQAPNPVFMPNYPGWGFYKFNPWRERFDEVIQRMLQAGLIDLWKKRTWERMKEREKFPIQLETKSATEPLVLDDLQGAFYLSWLMLGASVMAFIVEFAKTHCPR